MKIILVGLPGSGKSTIGRHLARKLQLPFTDTDAVIESRTGTSIAAFFDERGEDAFRAIEAAVLAELVDGSPGVLATGGGMVLRSQNRDCLRRAHTVIYLHAAPQDLARRLGRDATRPLLRGAAPLARLQELLAVRDPLYREVATHVVDTTGATASTLTDRVLACLERGSGASAEA